jgi:regulator of sigma E protease
VSWLLALVGFCVLIILHEFGHFVVAKAVGMRVERFSLFFPPLLVRKQIGETEYAIGALPLGGYVKISGMSPDEDLPDEVRTRAYTAQPVWKRIVVIAAGPAMNLLLALVLLFVFFWQIGPQDTNGKVGAIEKSFPAYHVLQPGDKLIAVDGKRGTPVQLSNAIAAHKCPQQPPVDRCKASRPATLLVERGGRQLRLTITPIYDKQTERTRLGFSYQLDGRKPYALGKAVNITFDQFWFITKETVTLPARIFNAQQRKEISGIVGITDVTHETIANDAAESVGLLAVISLSLAIINLFPFLPLDGGHIFWAVVEKLRGRAVPYSVMERAGVVGFLLVIMIFLIGFTNDIDRLTNGGFNVK